MALTLNAGRQNVQVAVVDFDVASLPAAVATPAIQLPPGAEVVGGSVVVSTAFDSTTTDVIDVGDAASANRYLNDGNIHATGRVALVPTGHKTARAAGAVADSTLITLTRTLTGATAATAGKGRLMVEYIVHGTEQSVYG